MQMSWYRSQEFGKHPGDSGQAKRKDLTLINNDIPLCTPGSKWKVQTIRWVYRHIQIGILEIQWHHPPDPCGYPEQQSWGSPYRTSKSRTYGLSPLSVEDGLEPPTSVLGSQDEKGMGGRGGGPAITELSLSQRQDTSSSLRASRLSWSLGSGISWDLLWSDKSRLFRIWATEMAAKIKKNPSEHPQLKWPRYRKGRHYREINTSHFPLKVVWNDHPVTTTKANSVTLTNNEELRSWETHVVAQIIQSTKTQGCPNSHMGKIFPYGKVTGRDFSCIDLLLHAKPARELMFWVCCSRRVLSGYCVRALLFTLGWLSIQYNRAVLSMALWWTVGDGGHFN